MYVRLALHQSGAQEQHTSKGAAPLPNLLGCQASIELDLLKLLAEVDWHLTYQEPLKADLDTGLSRSPVHLT